MHGQLRTHFARKFGVYLDAWKAGHFEKQFGVRHWRILTVTPSRERIENMITALYRMTDGKGSGLFLFIDEKTLADSNPLEVEWLSGKRERAKLTD